MKVGYTLTLLTAFAMSCVGAFAGVHQTTEGENAYSAAGGSALDAKLIETKDVAGATVARVPGSMNQWGFVNYWIGIPAPAGKSTIRLRIYNEAGVTAKYILYISVGGSQKMLKPIALPADAAVDSFVVVDVDVQAEAEWSGIILKKADASTNPSPWIDSISVVLPD